MATVRKFPLVLDLMEVNSEQVEQALGNFIPTDNKHTNTVRVLKSGGPVHL